MREALIEQGELERLLKANFPENFNSDSGLEIIAIWHGGCRIRQNYQDLSLRPGGTLSGSTMMRLADVCVYVAVLASVGWLPLAVTTNLNINFLRKPSPRALVGECQLLKLGKRLAVGDVSIRSEGGEEIVAHATATYSIPGSADQQH
jgi:uncharacterized protein (TIGR00369 family)